MRELPRLWDALHFRGLDWQVVADRDGFLALSPLQTGKPVVVAGTSNSQDLWIGVFHAAC